MHKSSHIQRTQEIYHSNAWGIHQVNIRVVFRLVLRHGQTCPLLDLPKVPTFLLHIVFTGHSRTIWLSYAVFLVECNVCYCPRIKLKCPYHNYYSSSFYQFWQLELLICTSTLVFKHFLYTIMPYISNAKIGCNFITPYFQHTQLQHFCPEIPQQRAGYSTSLSSTEYCHANES